MRPGAVRLFAPAVTTFIAAMMATAALAAESIVAHGVSAFGDLKYAPDFAHFDYVNPDAPKGGVYSSRGTAAAQTFDSLNPFILKGEPAQGMLDPQNVYFDTLMARAYDEPDAVYGLVAEKIEYPADRSHVIFHLRPEAKFADGSPVTADDIVFSLEVIKDKGAPRFKIAFKDLESATDLGDGKVRVDFREGAATRDLPMLAGSIPILSRAYYADRDFEQSTLDPPLNSGPYRVTDVKAGTRVVYERREDYWGRDLPVNRGRWNFDQIVFEYFRDTTAAFESFKAGAYEFHEEFYSKLWATGYDFPALDKGWVIRDVLQDGRPAGTQGYWFNIRREKFADPRLREALAMAFDFEWSNKTLFYGLYKRTDSFFEGSPMEADGAPDAAELALMRPLAADIPDSAFGEAYLPPVTDGSGKNRKNLRRAAKLLDAAGWKVGDDGMRQNAKGETLTVEFLDSSPAFERITGPYVQSLRRIGVDASQRRVDHAQYQQRLEDFDYDATVSRFSFSPTPGPEIRAFFSSEAADGRGSFNLAGMKNPAVDALLEHVIAAADREEMAVAVSALDRVLRSLHIWTPQWNKGSHTIAYWDKFGRPDTKPPYDRAVIDTWWVDADKAAALAAERAE